MDYLTKARTLLAELPPSTDRSRKEYDVMRALGYTVVALKGAAAPEFEAIYSRLREVSLELNDKTGLARASSGLQMTYYMKLELAKARELGEEAVAIADQSGDDHAIASTQFALGQTLQSMGEYSASLDHFKKADVPSTQGYHALSLAWSGWSQWFLGYPQRAFESVQQGRLIARKYRAVTRAMVLTVVCLIHIYRREPQAALESAEAMLALAAEHSLGYIAANGLVYRGWAKGMLGHGTEAVAEMQRGLSEVTRTGAAVRPTYLTLLAEVFGKCGRFREGLDALDEAIAVIERTGCRSEEPRILELKGELLLAMSPQAESDAQACFEKANDVARAQSAKSWELRTTTSLARLLTKQGKREEARTILAGIYNWFTEGFDTADLKDAKTLLDDLGTGS
jgi:tetratricopeptide (TPR) repeat protein